MASLDTSLQKSAPDGNRSKIIGQIEFDAIQRATDRLILRRACAWSLPAWMTEPAAARLLASTKPLTESIQ